MCLRSQRSLQSQRIGLFQGEKFFKPSDRAVSFQSDLPHSAVASWWLGTSIRQLQAPPSPPPAELQTKITHLLLYRPSCIPWSSQIHLALPDEPQLVDQRTAQPHPEHCRMDP